MNLREFIAGIKERRNDFLDSIKIATYNEVKILVEDIRKRSPIDKSDFINAWEMYDIGRTTSKSITYRIGNPLIYAQFLDQGADVGEVPWYWPSKDNPGPVSKSGKLRAANGKAWAGGRSPSGFVSPTGGIPGGIIDPVIVYNNRKQMEIMNNLADVVQKGIL